MKSIESTGKSVNQAIENGLKELGVTEDQVNVTVLTMGGLFTKYKVLLTVVEDEPIENKKVEEKTTTEKLNNLDFEKPIEMPAKISKPEVEKEEEKESGEETTQENIPAVIDPNAGTILNDFFKGMFETMNISAKVLIQEDDEKILVSIRDEENASMLIGHRGENLNCLQYIAGIVLSKNSTDTRRLSVDVENYRGRRDETLIELGLRTARKVAKTGRKIKLEPMNAYERRIIHTALQNDKLVTTFSQGTEPNRYLVIDLKR